MGLSMKILIALAMLNFWPIAVEIVTGANAQTPEQQQKGLGATVMALTQEIVMLRTQLVMAEDRIAAMKAEKPAPAPAAPAGK